MKKALALILALILLLSLAACSTTDNNNKVEDNTTPADDTETTDDNAETVNESSEDVGKKSIVLLVKNLNNSFWIEMSDAAKARCDELGWDLEVLAPIETDNNEQQIQLIEQSLINPPDLYIIIPTDSKGIVPAIEEVNDAGIPVIILNTAVIGDVDYITFLSCENYLLGYNVAKQGAELVGNTGKVVMLSGVPGSQNSIDRIEGARTAYEEAGMEIIDEQIANNDRTEGYTVTQTLLQKYDDIDVIYSANGEMALGASVALKEAGREGSIVIQTVDCYDEVIAAVNAGEIQICINNAGDAQAVAAINMALDYFEGKTIERTTTIDAECVTIDNIAPYLEKYDLN